MTTLSAPTPITPSEKIETLEDLVQRLGNIPLARVLVHPPIGTATEEDLIQVNNHGNRLCELVEGTLVEKAMGIRESILAMFLGELLGGFVRSRNLGLVTGPDGAVRLFPGLVRAPDVAFVSWDRIPSRQVPTEALPHLVPDLAVEVLSESNTKREMERKRSEYFSSGVRLVWIVDGNVRTVAVYTSPEEPTILDESHVLAGGQVLPDFSLPLRHFFAELDRRGDR